MKRISKCHQCVEEVWNLSQHLTGPTLTPRYESKDLLTCTPGDLQQKQKQDHSVTHSSYDESQHQTVHVGAGGS